MYYIDIIIGAEWNSWTKPPVGHLFHHWKRQVWGVGEWKENHLLCRSRLCSRWAPSQSAAAAAASWRPCDFPPAPSPWRIPWRSKPKSTDTRFNSSEIWWEASSYRTLYHRDTRWIKKKNICVVPGALFTQPWQQGRRRQTMGGGSRLVQCAYNDNQSPLLTSPCRTNYLEQTLTLDGGTERLHLATSNKVSRKAKKLPVVGHVAP